MPLVASGEIAIGGSTTNRSINLELGRTATTSSNLNETALRTLAGVASGQISLSNFYGKSNILPPSSVEYYVVAGGGGAGGTTSNGHPGGGGGGGVITGSVAVSTGVAYTVTVGGAGSIGFVPGQRGVPSAFSSITANGGGTGSRNFSAAATGGSGGGGSSTNLYTAGAAGTSGQGFAGGNGLLGGLNVGAGGGGGGAGAVGGNSASRNPVGDGGAGKSTFGGTFGGGGGGCSTLDVGAGGTGGGGGGGFGSTSVNTPQGGIAGTVNTGGGGGATAAGSSLNTGLGGSGIVGIRYSNTLKTAASTTGSPSFVNSGGYYIYTWTGSGSITW